MVDFSLKFLLKAFSQYSHLTYSRKRGKSECSINRRRSSFIVTPYCHKITLEYDTLNVQDPFKFQKYFKFPRNSINFTCFLSRSIDFLSDPKLKIRTNFVLPLALLPLLLGRHGLLTAWVIYLYPLDSIFGLIRRLWDQSSTQILHSFKKMMENIEAKFLASNSAILMNQILFFTLADRSLVQDKRTGLYSLVFYNFLNYCFGYLKELQTRGEETWAGVAISNSTNIRHLAMSATKFVLEWTKFVTFIATLLTFLIVLQLDTAAFTSTLFPPVHYTFITLLYYILMETIKPNTFTKMLTSRQYSSKFLIKVDQIQGLEHLYLKILQIGLGMILNVILIIPLLLTNTKLCILASYHNIYLQFKNWKIIRASIKKEWDAIDMFRIANTNEIQQLDDICSVCLCSLRILESRITKCNHFFHSHCLRLYLKKNGSIMEASCPICKRSL